MLSNPGAVQTSALTRSFGWDNRDVFVQQDVQEFSCILLDAIEKKVEAPNQTNFVKELFCGTMTNYIRCLKVEYKSERDEKFYDIQLPVKGFDNILDSLRDYTSEEDLSGANKYDTEKFGKQDAKKGIKFKKLPDFLFFHLRRFEFDYQLEQNIKITSKYEFTEDLNMKEFMHPDSQDQKTDYQLLSVLVHMGLHSGSGHYIAFIRPKFDQWYKFNDDTITKVPRDYVWQNSFGGEYQKKTFSTQKFEVKDSKSTQMSQAYMLVYVRANKIKSNIDPLLAEEVPDFIRAKVDHDNKLRRQENYWYEHKAFYVVLPDFLQGREMNGCMIDKQVHRDSGRIERFFLDPLNRMCWMLKKTVSLADFLENVKDWLELDISDCTFWKFDALKEWLVPLFSPKMLKEAKHRKLSTLFRETNYATTPVIFIQTRGESPQFRLVDPYPASPELERLGMKQETALLNRYTLVSTDRPLSPSEPSEVQIVPRKSLFLEIFDGEAIFLLVKRFRSGRFLFETAITVSAQQSVSSLGLQLAHAVLYSEESTSPGNTHFFEKGRITLIQVQDFDQPIREFSRDGICIFVVQEIASTEKPEPISAEPSQEPQPERWANNPRLSEIVARISQINDYAEVIVRAQQDSVVGDPIIKVRSTDTFEEVFDAICKLIGYKVPRERLKLETRSAANPREYDVWYDEPETRAKLFADILEVTQEIEVTFMSHSYTIIKENHVVSEVGVDALYGILIWERNNVLIPKTKPFSQLIKQNREALNQDRQGLFANLTKFKEYRGFEIG